MCDDEVNVKPMILYVLLFIVAIGLGVVFGLLFSIGLALGWVLGLLFLPFVEKNI